MNRMIVYLKMVAICFISFAICSEVHAQTAVAKVGKKPVVIWEKNIFYQSTKSGWQPVADVYWRVMPYSIHWEQDDNGLFFTRLLSTYIIKNQDTSYTIRDTFQSAKFRTIEETSNAHITSLVKIPIINGAKTISVFFHQGDTNFHFKEEKNIVLKNDGDVKLSDLQLIDTIVKMDYNGRFLKNGYYHLPRPYHFLDTNWLTVSVYSEIYKNDVEVKDFIVKTYISKASFGNNVGKTIHLDTIKLRQFAKLEKRIDFSNLSSGNYYVNQELIGDSNVVVKKSNIFVQVANPNPKVDEKADSLSSSLAIDLTNLPKFIDVNTTFLRKYNFAQLRSILKMLLPKASPPEAATINMLIERPDELLSRNFIYNYWLTRDATNPEKAWDEYAKLIMFVNKEYGSSFQKGYETDQGIIYLKYGKPNDIIRVNSEGDAYPYELWQYYAVGNTGREGVFLFYQKGSSLGQFTLLHSTVRGEMRNPNWLNMLYPSGAPVNTFSSRAYQLIGTK